MLIDADIPQHRRRVILMHLRLIIFPNINMVLAQREQYGDILLRNHMPLTEPRILRHPLNNLGDIVTKNLSHCIDCLHFFHKVYLPSYIGKGPPGKG